MKRYISLILCVLIFIPSLGFCSSAKVSYKMKLSSTSFVYDGKAKTPSVTVTANGKKLKSETDYKIKYPSKRTKVGTYTVTATFKGKYSGTKTASFRITPPPTKLRSVTGKPGSLEIRWSKKESQVSGYKIEYSTSSSFKSSSSVTVKCAENTKKIITDLKSSTNYYVRIRTYKTVNSKTYYSDWSPVLGAKTEKGTASSSGIPAPSKTGTNFYVTKTGSCYHRSKSCAGSSAILTSASYATEHYRPCSRCA